jgi:hypothetical protein
MYPKMRNTKAMLTIRKKSQHLPPFSCIYLASWTTVLPEKLKLLQIDKNGSRRLIIVFTVVRKLSLPCAKLMQSTPQHPSFCSSSGYPTKNLVSIPLSPMLATYPTPLIFSDLAN